MSSDTESGDFDIQEPEDGDQQDYIYSGEIELWEPIEMEFLDSNIQEIRDQGFSIEKIESWIQADPEKMRRLLTHWFIKRFDLWTAIGVIALIITRDSGLLTALLSSTGLFVILLVVIYHHYFHHPKK